MNGIKKRKKTRAAISGLSIHCTTQLENSKFNSNYTAVEIARELNACRCSVSETLKICFWKYKFVGNGNKIYHPNWIWAFYPTELLLECDVRLDESRMVTECSLAFVINRRIVPVCSAVFWSANTKFCWISQRKENPNSFIYVRYAGIVQTNANRFIAKQIFTKLIIKCRSD